MTSNFIIQLKGVNKKYFIHHEKPTLMESLLNGRTESFFALRNVNLNIRKGERIGLVGANGSGKTTLLKIIARIATPTSGKIYSKGKIVSLIDLGAGFHPDLTGIENIYLNGMIVGMGKKEIATKIGKIIAFANIGKFIDAPLFIYSEGMKLRLGFAVAVHSDPDVLIVDENISVGDEDFKKSSYQKIQELFRQKKTIIIASHDLNLVRKYSDKVCWLHKGAVMKFGKSKSVIESYLKFEV